MSNQFIEIMQTRRSIRRYKPDPIPDEIVTMLLETAVWAPSAHNRQPWRFVVVQQESTRHHLAVQMGQKLRQDLEADQVPAKVIRQDTTRSYQRITSAPLLILLCLTMEEMDRYPDPQRQQNEFMMAVQSTAMAGQNLLLAAHSIGLGACWMCAPLFCPDLVRQALDLPEHWHPQGLLTIGYPNETKQKSRHPLSHVVQYR